MATTREQSEAYAYENRRRTTSLFRGTDEALVDPRRRLNRSLTGGVAIGVLIMAGFGIAGWLGGGRGPGLPDNGAVVAGSDGDRYVVSDGVVHPALNLASALLVGGGGVTEVRQSTLDDAPRGLPVGIPGAPDALPGAGDLVDGDWTLCAVPSENGGDPRQTALYISVPGVAPAGTDAENGATVLVQAQDGGLWLLAEGRRYAIEPVIRDLLGLQGVEPVQLPTQIIATVPEGPEIVIPARGDGSGQPPAADLPFAAAVGDLVHTEAGADNPQYYVVRPGGLVAVSALVFRLLEAEAGAVHEVTAAEVARAPRADETAPGDRAWPDALPQADEPDRSQPVCVSTRPGSRPGDAPWQAVVHLPDTLPEPEGLRPVRTADNTRMGLLDAIWLPSGSGVVLRATTSAGTGGSHYLVTDSGTAFAFVSPEAVTRLGYDPQTAPSVPRSFVRLLPAGPTLDPAAAAREQRGAAADAAEDAEETEGAEETEESEEAAQTGGAEE